MKQATRIIISPLDHQATREPKPANAPDVGLRERLNHFARSLGAATREPKPANAPDVGLYEWLSHFARSLGARMNVHPGAEAVKHAIRPSVPPPPDHRTAREPEPDDAPDAFNPLVWLKHFALYLGAVTLACAIGIYFFWQIPFLRDPSQLLNIADDTRPHKPVAATVAPATPASPTQVAPSPPPVITAAPSQPPVTTDTVVVATAPPAPAANPAGVPPATAANPADVPPATATNPAGVPPALETQPAAQPNGQTEPVATPTEPPVEAVPPPTPEAEVDRLLAEAQQQIDNRRFTAPASGNALSTYRRVLELQPNHPAALNGIQLITTYYRDIAQQSLQQGRLDESLAYINRGLRAAPKNDALLSLRRQVQKAKQRELQEQQQTALEEGQQQMPEPVRQERLRRQQEQQQQQQPWWRQPSNNSNNSNNNEGSGFNQR
jgi:hypothetical protein